MKAAPLEQRIRAAMGERRSAQYHDLMAAVFPEADYPKAYRGSVNGGPPGCAMAFGAALRRMGWMWHGMGSARQVYRRDD